MNLLIKTALASVITVSVTFGYAAWVPAEKAAPSQVSTKIDAIIDSTIYQFTLVDLKKIEDDALLAVFVDDAGTERASMIDGACEGRGRSTILNKPHSLLLETHLQYASDGTEILIRKLESDTVRRAVCE